VRLLDAVRAAAGVDADTLVVVLGNLVAAQVTRYERTGEREALDAAVEHGRQAVARLAQASPRRAFAHGNLAAPARPATRPTWPTRPRRRTGRRGPRRALARAGPRRAPRSDFLRPPPAEELLAEAVHRPITMVNMSEARSDALILTTGGIQARAHCPAWPRTPLGTGLRAPRRSGAGPRSQHDLGSGRAGRADHDRGARLGLGRHRRPGARRAPRARNEIP
jgi:hypothetical protein